LKNSQTLIFLAINPYGAFAIERGKTAGKNHLLLYAKYVFYAEIRPDLALTYFLFFLVVSFLSIAKVIFWLFVYNRLSSNINVKLLHF